jgi:hypothetical protein
MARGSPGYTPPSPMSASLETEPGRLNGWKEIALHLGKGARTVQRWEKLYGLPVHRLGREGGEIVFAFRDEIDRWTASTERERAANGEEPPREGSEPEAGGATDGLPITDALKGSSAPPRRRWVTAAVVLLGVAAALATLSALWRPAGNPRGVADAIRQPATWRMGNESLTVFDGTRSPLFEHRFDFSLQEATSSETWPSSVAPPPVVIADVDGNGRSEVLVRPNAVERGERKLYCFEPDGRVRFVHQPLGTRRFGDDDYAEPWLAQHVFVTRGSAGVKRVWGTFTHNLLFPAVLQELDPRTGAVRQEYWSNGYIEVVHESTWAGRSVVLVGGTNNDFRAASLAVFPSDRVAGSTPAVRPGYACRDCAPGGPEALFVFPTLCISRGAGQAGVYEAWIESGQRVRVSVSQGPGATYYVLGHQGELLSAEISREFQVAHARLEREHVLDHLFGPTDDRDMFPVRRWDGTRFVDLPKVKVAH